MLLHCKQYTRRGAFHFHNCSDINIHKNSTKTFKITCNLYNCFFIVHYVIGFFLILVMIVLVKKNIVSVQGMR